jgi:hypothetical protein
VPRDKGKDILAWSTRLTADLEGLDDHYVRISFMHGAWVSRTRVASPKELDDDAQAGDDLDAPERSARRYPPPP